MPAATVRCVIRSIRMNAPVPRFLLYGSNTTGRATSTTTRPISLSLSVSASLLASVFTSTRWRSSETCPGVCRVVCFTR